MTHKTTRTSKNRASSFVASDVRLIFDPTTTSQGEVPADALPDHMNSQLSDALGYAMADSIASLPVAALIIDTESHDIAAANVCAAELFGSEISKMVGSSLESHTHPSFQNEVQANLIRTSGERIETFQRFMRDDKSSFLARINMNAHHRFQGFSIAVIDSTDESNRLSHDMFRAYQLDEMTGLLRREVFLELSRVVRTRYSTYGMLFIDLDNLKVTNDNLGHHVGDALIVSVAHRLSKRFRKSDLIGRLGGDEFVVFVAEPHTASSLASLASSLWQLLETEIRDLPGVAPQLSIGSAIAGGACPIETTMAAADNAMYEAKAIRKAGHKKNTVASKDVRVVVAGLDVEPASVPVSEIDPRPTLSNGI